MTTPRRHSIHESQRDSDLQPRVARNELPWEIGMQSDNPNGVVALGRHRDATPSGLPNQRHAAKNSTSELLSHRPIRGDGDPGSIRSRNGDNVRQTGWNYSCLVLPPAPANDRAI